MRMLASLITSLIIAGAVGLTAANWTRDLLETAVRVVETTHG